ncbi:MAG: FAD/FMN-containing dehydrogenase [Planctomycetota bacterium]|jgi:FAD/FMN-containing dehydrogenase
MSTCEGQFVAIRNQEELRQLIGVCANDGTAIIPTSSATMPPLLEGEEDHCVISLAELDQVISYAADDLTMTVEVGAKVADIQRIVAKQGQRLTVELPNPETTTVGALVGMGTGGFIANTHGGVAGQVLGIEAFSGDGRRLVGGGRVVKNVTGYDFVRLLCGSAGSLGIITEVTFRLRPQPPREATFVLQTKTIERSFEVAMALRQSLHVLTAIVVVAGAALHDQDGGPLIFVRAEGSSDSIVQLGESLVHFDCPVDQLEGEESRALWQEVCQFPSSQPFHLKLTLPPSRVSLATAELPVEQSDHSWGLVVDMQRASIDFTCSRAFDLSQEITEIDVKKIEEDHHAVASLPDELSDREGRWDRFTHPAAGARKIGDRIKIAFDPVGILMPKRPIAGSF